MGLGPLFGFDGRARACRTLRERGRGAAGDGIEETLQRANTMNQAVTPRRIAARICPQR